jgi:hypothetical protein
VNFHVGDFCSVELGHPNLAFCLLYQKLQVCSSILIIFLRLRTRSDRRFGPVSDSWIYLVYPGFHRFVLLLFQMLNCCIERKLQRLKESTMSSDDEPSAAVSVRDKGLFPPDQGNKVWWISLHPALIWCNLIVLVSNRNVAFVTKMIRLKNSISEIGYFWLELKTYYSWFYCFVAVPRTTDYRYEWGRVGAGQYFKGTEGFT